MKKLLTVVLCVAVIFTFSFSGAFATTGYSSTLVEEYLTQALDDLNTSSHDGIEIKSASEINLHNATTTTGYYYVTYDTLVAQKAALLDAATEYAKAAANDTTYIGKDGKTIKTLLEDINTNPTHYTNTDLAVDLVLAQFEADKQEAIDALNSVSLSDISTDEMDDSECDHTVTCDTYKDHVKKILEDAVDTINNYSAKVTTTITGGINTDTFVGNKLKIDKYVLAFADSATGKQTSNTEALLLEKAYKSSGNTYVGLGTWELNLNYVDKDSKNDVAKFDDFTKDTINGDDSEKAAAKSEAKAWVATKYAAYIKSIKNDDNKSAKTTCADNLKETLEYLIDNHKAKDKGNYINTDNNITTNFYEYVNTWKSNSGEWWDNPFGTFYAQGYKSALAEGVKKAAEFKENVEVLAAETDAAGNLVRDKEDVEDALREGLVKIYMAGTVSKAAVDSAYETAYNSVSVLTTSLDDARLAYFKAMAKNELNDAYADAEDGTLEYSATTYSFYAPELETIKGYVDKYSAEIDSATKHSQIEKALDDFEADVKKVDTKSDVQSYISQAGLVDKVASYAGILNGKLSGDKQYYVDRYQVFGAEGRTNGSEHVYEKITKEVYDLVGASTARSKSAVEDMEDEAMNLVKSFPTVGEVKDAKQAVKDAIDDLPKTIKSSDASTIDAAITALEAYQDLSRDDEEQAGTNPTTAAGYGIADVKAAVMKLAYAMNNDFSDKYDALSSTDKAGLEALKDEINAFRTKYEDYFTKTDKTTVFGSLLSDINSDLNDIQEDAYDAVKAAINKIPAKANITEAATDVIKAARAAYDAYVAEYKVDDDLYSNFQTGYN